MQRHSIDHQVMVSENRRGAVLGGAGVSSTPTLFARQCGASADLRLERVRDWPDRLTEAARRAQREPFQLGWNDCILFAANCCFAVTGVDPMKPWRGRYHSDWGALRLLREYGFADTGQWADSIIGPRISVDDAQPGDWCLAPPGLALALGVCIGDDAAFVTHKGVVSFRTEHCSAAWPIGRPTDGDCNA